VTGPALTSLDRMAVGRARTKLRRALEQLDLALERGNRDTNEAALRVGYAALVARDGADLCKRLYLALDRQDDTDGG